MKLYITGCPGSGKSTLARRVAEITGIPCAHLDEVMYEPDPADPGDNRKRDPSERQRLFDAILAGENWIMEDAGRECFRAGMEAADMVIALNIPRAKLRFRATRRWLRQRAGRERASYRPDITMLRLMWKWIGEYDLEAHILFPEKTRILQNQQEIHAFICEIAH